MPRPVKFFKTYHDIDVIENKEKRFEKSISPIIIIIQVAIKRDAGQELQVQKWICEVLGQPGMFDKVPYEDVLKV